jgi:fatty acid-binding protein DegV
MEPASSKIAIVTETLCCMSDRDCEAYGVRMIPLTCQVGSSVTGDRVISSEQPVPDGDGRSVPPTEEAYRTHFAGLVTAYDGVLCITASR